MSCMVEIDKCYEIQLNSEHEEELVDVDLRYINADLVKYIGVSNDGKHRIIAFIDKSVVYTDTGLNELINVKFIQDRTTDNAVIIKAIGKVFNEKQVPMNMQEELMRELKLI